MITCDVITYCSTSEQKPVVAGNIKVSFKVVCPTDRTEESRTQRGVSESRHGAAITDVLICSHTLSSLLLIEGGVTYTTSAVSVTFASGDLAAGL